MGHTARVSVVIPTYNCAQYLPDAIASILAQTRPVDEIIVINDGSTDATEEVIAPYRECIVYLEQPNAGQAAARNRGLDMATGDWVAFLDADDVWLPTKIDRQLDGLANPGQHICGHTAFSVFGECTDPVVRRPAATLNRYDVESLLTRLFVLPSTVLVRGGLPTRFRPWARTSEDAIYFAELATLGRFAYLDEPLVRYRKHASSVTTRQSAATDSLTDRLRWIDEQSTLGSSEKARLTRLVAASHHDYLTPILRGRHEVGARDV